MFELLCFNRRIILYFNLRVLRLTSKGCLRKISNFHLKYISRIYNLQYNKATVYLSNKQLYMLATTYITFPIEIKNVAIRYSSLHGISHLEQKSAIERSQFLPRMDERNTTFIFRAWTFIYNERGKPLLIIRGISHRSLYTQRRTGLIYQELEHICPHSAP